MLVHRRVTPSIKFAGTHLYTWAERGTVRVKCLAQEHSTKFPVRRSGDETTNHEATAPSTLCELYSPLSIDVVCAFHSNATVTSLSGSKREDEWWKESTRSKNSVQSRITSGWFIEHSGILVQNFCLTLSLTLTGGVMYIGYSRGENIPAFKAPRNGRTER